MRCLRVGQCFSRWVFMFPCVLNDLQQSSHVYGFSPVCDRMWMDSALLVGNPFPHVSHPYSLRRGGAFEGVTAPPIGVIGPALLCAIEASATEVSNKLSAKGDSSASFSDNEDGSSFKDKPRPLSGAESDSSFSGRGRLLASAERAGPGRDSSEA